MTHLDNALTVMERQTDALDNVHLYMLQLNKLTQALAEQMQSLALKVEQLQARLEQAEPKVS